VTADASKELDIGSASTGGKMNDISFRGLLRERERERERESGRERERERERERC
jgi:hypothetical protein